MDRSRRLTRQERQNWGRNSNSNTGSTAVAQDYTFRQGETATDYINRNFSNPALRRTQLSLASSSQTPQTDTAITTSTLTPEQPITTPVIQQPTQSGGLASDVTSKAEAFANSVVNSTVDKSTVDDARKGFFEKMMGQKTKSQLQGDEYSATVDPAKKELDDIQNQIRERSLAYRRQEEELQKNTRGLFGGALQQETNRIRQEGAKELADLSIIEQAKLTNYSTAKDIADRAINAQLEQQSKELDAWKFWYTENKEQFTKEEDRRFTAMIGERERLLNEDKADKKLISDSVIDALGNGLPTNLAQQALKAKTFDEAIGLIGPYMRDQEKALRIQKLNAEILEKNPSIDLSKISQEGKEILNSVNNLRFKSSDEGKRIVANITKLVSEGDIDGARETLRDFGYQKLSASQQSDFDLYENAISAAASALAQINSQSLITGPYKALAEKAKPWSTIKNDKAYSDLRSVIELGQAQVRKGFYGTAVTGTEAGNAKNFLITDNDSIDVIRWKLDNMENFLQFANDATISRSVGLPKPNLDDYLTYRVRDVESGEIGVIPRSEYDSSIYQILN